MSKVCPHCGFEPGVPFAGTPLCRLHTTSASADAGSQYPWCILAAPPVDAQSLVGQKPEKERRHMIDTGSMGCSDRRCASTEPTAHIAIVDGALDNQPPTITTATAAAPDCRVTLTREGVETMCVTYWDGGYPGEHKEWVALHDQAIAATDLAAEKVIDADMIKQQEKQIVELKAEVERLRKTVKVAATVSKLLLEAEVERLTKERGELEIQLSAWQSVFGTSQLSHAQARLERAEAKPVITEAQIKEIAQKYYYNVTDGIHSALDYEQACREVLRLVGMEVQP